MNNPICPLNCMHAVVIGTVMRCDPFQLIYSDKYTSIGRTWLKCDGRWLKKRSYPTLYAILKGTCKERKYSFTIPKTKEWEPCLILVTSRYDPDLEKTFKMYDGPIMREVMRNV